MMSREEVVQGKEGGWKWGISANEKRVSFRADEHVLRLIVQLCEYTKSRSIVHFKQMNYISEGSEEKEKVEVPGGPQDPRSL